MINPPIYRLTTAVSDIDQTNINRDIRDGNWLSSTNWWQNISTQRGGKWEHNSSHLNCDNKLIDSGKLQQIQTKLQFHFISGA